MKKSAKHKRYAQKDGRRLYEQDRARLMADPKMKKLYSAEAAKKAMVRRIATG